MFVKQTSIELAPPIEARRRSQVRKCVSLPHDDAGGTAFCDTDKPKVAMAEENSTHIFFNAVT